MKICLHQFLRPKYVPKMNSKRGDCSICTIDEKNEKCSEYTPITVIATTIGE